MNILFTYQNFDSTKGGIAKTTCTLSDRLKREGMQLFFLASEGYACPEDNLYVMPSKSFDNSEENCKFIKNFIAKKNIDIWVNQNGFAYLDLISRVCPKNVSLISCIHYSILGAPDNLDTLKYNILKKYRITSIIPLLRSKVIRTFLRKYYIWQRRESYRNMLKSSDKVVLLDKSAMKEMEEMVGYLPENCLVIPNSLKESDWYDEKTEKENIILWVGRVVKSKRLDLFIYTWEKLYQRYPKWKVQILGNGDSLAEMVNYVKQKNIKNIEFKGFVNVADFFKKSKIFAFTSAYEGFGMVITEAQANKCSVISFDSFPAVKTLIKNEETGILIENRDLKKYAENLEELMVNEKKREYLAKNAYANVKKFHIDNVVLMWNKLFNEVLYKGK